MWLPGERTVFVGNLFGPVFGHVPNLYTIRGDKIRSAQTFLHCVDRVIALEPEMLITGHDRFEGARGNRPNSAAGPRRDRRTSATGRSRG